jgi:hypothetical protein
VKSSTSAKQPLQQTGPALRLFIVQRLSRIPAAELGRSFESQEVEHTVEPALDPTYPILLGRYHLTKHWFFELPGKFNHRFEDGGKVFWRPGFFFEFRRWKNTDHFSTRERVDQVKRAFVGKVDHFEEEERNDVAKISFRDIVRTEDKLPPAYTCYLIDDTGQIGVLFNFDDEADLAVAKAIWASFEKGEPVPAVTDHGLQAERFFDDSSLSRGESPKLVVICGGVCAGKTTLRRTQYRTGFVVVDAAEIFLDLCRGEYYAFPGPFTDALELIGSIIADRAVHERRNIVTEIIGDKETMLSALLDAFGASGYKVEYCYIDADPKEGWLRNLNRGDDNISAHDTQEFHERWLLRTAAHRSSQAKKNEGAGASPS